MLMRVFHVLEGHWKVIRITAPHRGEILRTAETADDLALPVFDHFSGVGQPVVRVC